jgi:hypothetical protein
VKRDLQEVADWLQRWKLAEAETALVRAEGRVAGGSPADLIAPVRRMRADLDLVGRLDRIRLQRATVVHGRFDHASAERDYAAVFRERMLVTEGEDPGTVADRLRGSPARAQLVAALDDWAFVTKDPGRRAWLLEVARRADPGAWSDRFRDPARWTDRAALEQLAREAEVAELSPHLLTGLGAVLLRRGGTRCRY